MDERLNDLQNALFFIRNHCEEMHSKHKKNACKNCPLCEVGSADEDGCSVCNVEYYSSPKDWIINQLGKPTVHKFFI